MFHSYRLNIGKRVSSRLIILILVHLAGNAALAAEPAGGPATDPILAPVPAPKSGSSRQTTAPQPAPQPAPSPQNSTAPQLAPAPSPGNATVPPPPPPPPEFSNLYINVHSSSASNPLTSSVIGVNSGHSRSKSNAWIWHKRLGINGLRRFFNYRQSVRAALGNGFGFSQNGDFMVNSSDTFIQAVTQLRTVADITTSMGTANSTFVQWSTFVNGSRGLDAPSGATGSMKDVFDQCAKLNIDVLLIPKVTCRSPVDTYFNLTTFDNTTAEYWAERWELYRWFYAIGVWAHDNNVVNIEILNEPELEPCIRVGAKIVPTGYMCWRDHYLIRPQALRAAYTDRSNITGNDITPVLWGAPFASWQSYNKTSSLGLNMMQDNYLSFPDLTYNNSVPNIDTYSYHTYGFNGYDMGGLTNKLQRLISQTVQSGPNSNATAPVYITEYNPSTSFGWNSILANATIDDPDQAAFLAGQILATSVSDHSVDKHYVFKVSQTATSKGPGVVKSGLLWGDNSKYGKNDIGDSTRAAEVMGLIVRKVGGSQINYAVTSPGRSVNQTLGAVEDFYNYYLYIVNAIPINTTVTVNLNEWKIPPSGSPIILNQVSEAYMAEVADIVPISDNATMTFVAPPNSLTQAVIPKTTSPIVTTLYDADADATIKAGSNSNRNYGSQDNLQIGFGSPNTPDSSSATFVRFSDFDTSSMLVATLSLTVRSAGSNARNVFTVLGLPSDAHRFDELAITWAKAPYIKPTKSQVNSIAKNVIAWDPANFAPEIVGHLTVPPSATNGTIVTVDVTDFIRSGGTQFIIYRPFRTDPSGSPPLQVIPDNVTDSLVVFESRETPTIGVNGPLLTIYST